MKHARGHTDVQRPRLNGEHAQNVAEDVRRGEMMYHCVSDLATCCADSWCNEPLLTRSSPTS